MIKAINLKSISSKEGTVDLTTFWGMLLWFIFMSICSLNKAVMDFMSNLMNRNQVLGAVMIAFSWLICIIISTIVCSIIERKQEGSWGLNKKELKEFRRNKRIENIIRECEKCPKCQSESLLVDKLISDCDNSFKVEYECACGERFYWNVYIESESITKYERFIISK